MTAACLTIAALLGLAAEPGPAADPSALVERLGSPRFAEREQAAAALQALGPDALAALRAGRQARDPEVRARAAALRDRIESEQMVRPTVVALDFRDRPLAEVARELGDRAHVRLVLQPDNANLWKDDRVTLEAPGPVTFWAAIDRLCAAAHLQHDPNNHWPQPAGPLPALNLTRGGPGGVPASSGGPFRVHLVGLNHSRFINFNNGNGLAPAPARLVPAGGARRRVVEPLPPPQAPAGVARADGVVTDNFTIQLQVMAEPRLLIGQGGQMHFAEALDSRGQSLLPPANGEGAGEGRAAYYNGTYNSGVAQSLQLNAQLRYPEPHGDRIKVIRGTIPLGIATRKPDPLVVTLEGAAGKSFRTDSATLILHELKPDPNGQGTLIDVTLRSHGGPSLGAGPRGEVRAFPPIHTPQTQLEVCDAQGRPLPFYARNTAGQPGDARLSLVLMGRNDAGPPAQLRYYDLVRAEAEAPFEFRDLPMP